MKRVHGIVIGMLIVIGLTGACSKEREERTADRLWLAERTAQFVGVYKATYERVAQMQGTAHPCMNGHKAAEAALFHAVIRTMNQAFTSYTLDVEKRLSARLAVDSRSRSLVEEVRGFSAPFATQENIERCGKVDLETAKRDFYLKDPVEISRDIELLRKNMEND